MNQYQRAKLNKILIIIAIVLAVIAVGVGAFFFITSGNKEPEVIDYQDTIVVQGFFEKITISLSDKTVKRDNKETTLQQEFGIPNEQADLILNSNQELKEYFSNSTFDVDIGQEEIVLTDPYQTKSLIVEASEIKDDFDAIEDPIKIKDGLFILKYDTEKRAKAASDFLKAEGGATKVQPDEILMVDTVDDESQTMYGEQKENEDGNAYGVLAMGIDNYKKIINENGNAANIVVSTIGYGAAIDNTYFKDKISGDYYNFLENSKENMKETIPQGSRTLEVIKESTTDNIKILPLVVVNENNYTTVSTIVQALIYASQKSDVICYELIHRSNETIKQTLESIFKENKPVCCATKNVKEGEEVFPANDATTIAVSSVDRNLKTTSYSSTGDYIDFVASSTDVKEIFNSESTVSKWSGAEYSNAYISSIVALVKSYNKNATILDIYNFIRNFCQDLGAKGKDSIYGYGFPNFSKLQISDIDKQYPDLVDVNIDDSNWERTKKVQIKATDNIKIYGWNVTKSSDVPKDWKRSDNVRESLNISENIDDNGKFYVWVVDTAGNARNKSFDITKVDKVAPTIQYRIDDSKLEKEKYVTINATATDEQSGLHDMPYSWDKVNWGKDNTILRVTSNGTYTLFVRDKLENIAERHITINNLPEQGTAEIDPGKIIKEITVSDKWEGNRNKEVTITFNDNLDIKRRKIIDNNSMPEEFRPSQSEDENNTIDQNTYTPQTTRETNTTNETVITTVEDNSIQGHTNVTVTVELEVDKKYYIWIEDNQGNVTSQGFMIKKAEQQQ